MKKSLYTLLLAASLSANAQITLEHYYPTGNILKGYLKLVQLSAAGYKYVLNDTNTITLYNLNHTVYLTINIPPRNPPASSSFYGFPQILYVSDELFNTNPADIEYFIYYEDASGNNDCRIYDQVGSILFSKDSVVIDNYDFHGYVDITNFISYSPSGVKMIIPQQYGSGATVYSLPGTLPCNDCTGGTVTALRTVNGNTPNVGISNYPNPANNQTTVQYNLPEGITTAELVFYNIQGVEVKRFKVTNAFTDILISTADLEAGTYYYQIQAANSYSAGKKMIVIK